jgi:choline dehydrogenase
VLPYFCRLETDEDFGNEPWHGDSGPLPSRRYVEREFSRQVREAIEALTANGHPWVDDHNRPGAVGVGRMPMNTRDGKRVTTADAYLANAPTTLTVQADTTVDRVLLTGNRATGVRLADGSVLEADGVVLSAGVYGSPAVLLRSGIELAGVGENLADHPGVLLDLGYQGAASKPVLHSITSFRSSEAPPDGPPDLLFWIADPNGDPAEFGVEIVLMKSKSRGSVRVRSVDPQEPPIIRLPNLEDQSDVRRLMEGYRHALEVFKLAPVDDRRLEEKVRAEEYSIPHVVGTCALGSVVDVDGQVVGTDGLWVADASIIPDAPSGFVHFPTVMLAERLSERIASVI